MSDTFSNFLKTGELVGLALGSPQDDVLRVLGEPEDHTNRRHRPEIWKYDGLQITFLDGFAVLIGIYFDEYESSLPKNLKMVREFLSHKTDLNEFTKYLLHEGIGFRQYAELTIDDQVCLLLESGIQIIFKSNKLMSILLSKLK